MAVHSRKIIEMQAAEASGCGVDCSVGFMFIVGFIFTRSI